MNDFVRDCTSTGDLRLPRGRIAEMTSALQAVDSLIGRLARFVIEFAFVKEVQLRSSRFSYVSFAVH